MRKIRIPMSLLEESHNPKRVEEDRSIAIEVSDGVVVYDLFIGVSSWNCFNNVCNYCWVGPFLLIS